MKINRGIWLILTVALGVAAGFIMTHLLSYFPANSQFTPTVLLAALSAPVVYLWHCITKLTELKKLSGISKSEYRRLVSKINASKLFYSLKMGFIILCNMLIAYAFFLAPSTVEIFSIPILKIAVAMLGFMAVFSCLTLIESYIEAHTIQEFEAKVANRENNKRQVEESLSKLKPLQSK